MHGRRIGVNFSERFTNIKILLHSLNLVLHTSSIMFSKYILPAIAAVSGAYGMFEGSFATNNTITNSTTSGNGTALNQITASSSRS